MDDIKTTPTVETWAHPEADQYTKIAHKSYYSLDVKEFLSNRQKFIRCRFEKMKFTEEISSCYFIECEFIECDFTRIAISDVYMYVCVFNRCNFWSTEFITVRTEETTFEKCIFNELTRLSKTRLVYPRKLETNIGLHKVWIMDDNTRYLIDTDLIVNIGKGKMGFLYDKLSWENLRAIGRLPLFGLSYTAMIAIPIMIFLVAFYNEQVNLIQTNSASIIQNHIVKSVFESYVLNNITSIQLSWATIGIILSTVSFGIASTIYTFWCPSIIKEYSLVTWRFSLKQGSINYLPLSWSRKYYRIAAWIFYVLGGSISITILIIKLTIATIYVTQNL